MSLAERARAAFDAYAGMDAPHLPADRFSALQVRHHRWQIANFGARSPMLFVLGIVEEVCDEMTSSRNGDDIRDAAADALIFATGLCTQMRLDFGTIVASARAIPEDKADGADVIACGRLAHLALKHEQRIRGIDDGAFRDGICEQVAVLWSALRSILALRCDEELEATYFATAEEVLKRDWRADAKTGGA